MLISLAHFLSTYPDHELIIGGDFNGIDEGDPSEEGSIAWFTVECGVVGIHADFHTGPFPSTYDRGSKRIDQIYVSDRLSTENLVHASILGEYDSIFPSDHHPLFLDFDTQRFFDASSFTYQLRRDRILRYTDPRLTRPYLKHALNGLSNQKLDDKLAHLPQRVHKNEECTRRDKTAMNEIDQVLTAILLSAERCLRPPPRINRRGNFSVELDKGLRTIAYWRCRCAAIKSSSVTAT